MLQLSKKVDYALMALMDLAKRETPRSAREIAEGYGLPPDLLAKILQKLAKDGLVASQQGTKGGYRLAEPAGAIHVVRVIEAVEGPLSLTRCWTDLGACDQLETCNIKSPLQRLNDHVVLTLSQVTIAAMCDDDFRFLAGAERGLMSVVDEGSTQLPVIQS